MGIRMSDPRILKWMRNLTNFCILILFIIGGPVLVLLLSAIAVIGDAGYNFFDDAISMLVFGPRGWLETAVFVLIGVVMAVFALRLHSSISVDIKSKIGIILLVSVGVSFILTAIFPTAPNNAPPSFHSFIHGLLSHAVPLLFIIASFMFGAVFRSDPRWKTLSVYTYATGAAIVVLIALSATVLNPLAGLYERLLLLIGLSWVEVVAGRLLLFCLGPPKPGRRPF